METCYDGDNMDMVRRELVETAIGVEEKQYEVFRNDESVRRNFFTEIFEKLDGDPDLKSDRIEVLVKFTEQPDAPDFHCLQLGDYWCEAETSVELEFLVFLNESLKRGTQFEEAWQRAVKILTTEDRFSRLVYELQPDDDLEIDYWIKRITAQGVDEIRARELGTEIVPILSQIYLTDDNFKEFFSEDELEIRKILLEKLS